MSTTTDRAAPRRRFLLAALAATALVLAVDLSGAADLTPVRTTAAAVLGPLERLAGPDADEVSRLRAENLGLSTRLEAAQREAAAAPTLAAIVADPSLSGASLVPARVVAVGASGPAGPERVTIDVGSRDGVETDRAVVAQGGLVGRVVAVAPWTSDVVLVGGPDLAVGVRVGEDGVLAQASGSAIAGAPRLEPGSLSLSLVESGSMRLGDTVTTLGSVGGTPYPPGVRVGTVSAVDPVVGRVAPTGSLVLSVDPTTLDVVAVLVDGPRSTPRPSVTGGPG